MLTDAELRELRNDYENFHPDSLSGREVESDITDLLDDIDRYRALIETCIEHLEDCTDTWTPTDPLLRALKVSLAPGKPRPAAPRREPRASSLEGDSAEAAGQEGEVAHPTPPERGVEPGA